MRIKKAKRNLTFTALAEQDANGNQILVVRGERFFYVDEGKAGKGTGADHVWASEKGAS
jgi:hypothetical protein